MKRQNGFTIMELVVAISIFATVGIIAVGIFVNVTRIQGRITLENAIYEDARFMMERLSRAIKYNAIDYEEYFNQAISDGLPADEKLDYGDKYGAYAAMFYNPGKGAGEDLDNGDDPAEPGSLGAYCTNGDLYVGQNCVVYRESLDINTGKFPYEGLAVNPAEEYSNAFCPTWFGNILGDYIPTCTADANSITYPQEILFLISEVGNKKTIFGWKAVNDSERALAMLELVGLDGNNDGIYEQWSDEIDENKIYFCEMDYDCKLDPGKKLADTLKSEAGIYQGFVPISPLRTNIKDLSFSIFPIEDPHKAFAEAENISNPRVVVTLTVTPSQSMLYQYGNPDNPPEMTLQTTISSRVNTEVKSYIGHETKL